MGADSWSALLVWVIGLSLGGTTAMPSTRPATLARASSHALFPIPARAAVDWGYSWIPVVGPLVGAAIAAIVLYGGLAPMA